MKPEGKCAAFEMQRFAVQSLHCHVIKPQTSKAANQK